MFLPYERQITELLQELMHFRAVAVRSQQEKARYAEELNETCQEIEQALYEMGKRQTIVPVSYTHLDVYKRQVA